MEEFAMEWLGMVDLLFCSWNRKRYTELSFAALLANTDWSLVAKLILADDASEDGTREWLAEAVRAQDCGCPTDFSPRFDGTQDFERRKIRAPRCESLHLPPVEFARAPFGGPVAAVNAYLRDHRSAGAETLGKIDNDTMAPPGWLPELLGLLERHPDVDLLGMAPDLGPPEPCPFPGRTVRAAPFVDGNGLWRLRAFDGRQAPRPRRSDCRHGFTQWQQAHPKVVKAWAAPDLPVFQLDQLPFEPWLSLAAEYVAAGWQRRWPPFDRGAGAYWEWAALEAVPA